MNSMFVVILLVWASRILLNIFSYIQLWRVKEYRFDRMRIHLHTDQGKRILFLPYRGFRISPKTIGLALVTIASVVYAYTILPIHPILRLLFLDLASFPLTAFFVLLIGIPQRIYHRMVVGRAREKLQNHPGLFVIGITGSYGKTSTKEYLATILSSQFTVLATEASKNSLIGISEVILQKLTTRHQVFVVEMGAYKRGEIAEMAQLVHPQVGIITAINEQHQDLFGSIETTMKAKYELLQSLTGKRIAILGTGGGYMATLTSWAKRDGLNVVTPSASNVVGKSGTLSFAVNLGNTSAKVSAAVAGNHQAQNIALAVAAAVSSGMNLADAAGAAGSIVPVDRMMKPTKGINGAIFIDDTFNNNPDAAIAAINYLSTARGKKILVFQPMIELGAYAQSAHERVGKRAGEVCDEIILTNTNYQASFLKGVGEKNIVHVFDPRQAGNALRSTLGPGDVVVFKGKEAEKILRELV